MRTARGWWVFVVWGLALGAGAEFPQHRLAAEQSGNQVVCPLAVEAPVVDGVLDDACWEHAGRAAGFRRWKKDVSAEEQTAVLIAHTDEALAVAFIVKDERIAFKTRERDERLAYLDDCVELFLDPQRQRTDRAHFILTAGGALYDASDGDVTWSASPEPAYAVKRVEGRGWTAELLIPYAALAAAKPVKGEVWDLKLAREDYDTPAGAVRLSSWQFVSASFSDPGAFGRLVFQSSNLSENGDFSNPLPEVARRTRDDWVRHHWRVYPDYPEQLFTMEDVGRTAPAAGRLAVTDEHPVVSIQHWVPGARPFRKYKVSVWVNLDALSGRRKVNLRVNPDLKGTKVFADPRATGWQKIQTYVTTQDDAGVVLNLQILGSKGSILVDDVEVVELDNVPRAEGDICYTGNAKGEQERHNQRADGQYRYLDFGIRAEWPPEVSGRGGWPDVRELPGWIGFHEGRLTDGLPTYVHWTGYGKHPGKTLVLDLGADRFITDVSVEPVSRNMSEMRLYLRQNEDTRSTLVAWLRGGVRGLTDITGLDAHARWVRIDHRGPCGLREVRVWGRDRDGMVKITPFVLSAKPGVTAGGGPALADVDLCIYPTPKELKRGKGTFSLGETVTISASVATNEEFAFIAEDLARELSESAGVGAKVVTGKESDIRLVLATVPGGKEHEGEEGYTLRIDETGAVVTGGGLNGVFYGCQTLLQCLVRQDGASALQCVAVRDWPALPLRITQFWDKHLKEHPSGMRALSRIRWNTILYASAGGTYGPRVARELAKHRLGAMPTCAAIPGGGWYQGNPETIERYPGEKAADLPSRARVMPCPSHPEMDQLIARQVAVAAQFPGRYAWMNIDECYQEGNGARWNVCDLCRARGLSGGDLFYDHMMKVYRALEEIGKIPAAMGLMLYHVNYKGIPEGFARLPKDMPLTVWHSGGHLKCHEHGFETIEYPISFNWRSDPPDRPSLGLFYSADWHGFSPTALVTWGERAWAGKDLYGELLSSRMLRQIDQGLGHMRAAMSDVPQPSRTILASDTVPIDLTPAANCSFADVAPADGVGLVDVGPGMDLSFMAGETTLGGVRFKMGGEGGKDFVVLGNRGILEPRFDTSIRIPVGRQAASLVFLHGLTEPLARNYSTKISFVGNYFIEFDDGTRMHYPIEFDRNIRMMFDNPFSDDGPPAVIGARLTYRGVTPSGDNIRLMSAEWVNPFPAKTIRAVTLRGPARMMDARVALFGLTAVKAGKGDLAFWAGRSMASLGPEDEVIIPSALKPIDLAGGRFVSPTRYEAPDGTVISAASCSYLDEKSLVFRLHQGVGWVTQDDNRGWQFLEEGPQSLTLSFAAPRRIGAVSFMGRPAVVNSYIAVKIAPIDVTVEVSQDGEAWEEAGRLTDYLSERDLEGRVVFDSREVAAVRLSLKLSKGAPAAYYKGLARVQIYEDSRQ